MNADGLKNTDPVPIDSENLYLKEFTNPSPVVKVAELSGASSNFGAQVDAMVRFDFQNSLSRSKDAVRCFEDLLQKGCEKAISVDISILVSRT